MSYDGKVLRRASARYDEDKQRRAEDFRARRRRCYAEEPRLEEIDRELSRTMGKIIARGLRASQLEMHILSGKGKIIASGKCDDLSLRLVGTGEIQADQVTATNVSCRIMGTGSIGCHVDGGQLKVNGSGTGKVYYKGTPSKVTVRKLGTIKAIPMK